MFKKDFFVGEQLRLLSKRKHLTAQVLAPGAINKSNMAMQDGKLYWAQKMPGFPIKIGQLVEEEEEAVVRQEEGIPSQGSRLTCSWKSKWVGEPS